MHYYAIKFMNKNTIILKPGTLWTSVKKTTAKAIETGALKSLDTELEIIEHDGVKFLVRILTNINSKQKAAKKKDINGQQFNPFLPPEPDLFVTEISDTHICILNKFNVVDHHLLIVTRNFVEQETLLDLADFTATWTCLQDVPGLVFYNGGKIAGASQKHKHLQLVPFTAIDIPITPLLALATFSDDVGMIPDLPFLHAFAKISITDDITTIYQKYQTLIEYIGITEINHKQSAAYNLLATREWLLIVPRKLEKFAAISINSLGFAGCLLVKNKEQMQLVKDIKPMNILSQVAWEKVNIS